ncbi:MAG: diaminopimelate decarboxylase [Alphaproteobacteria bacterium]|nr:diaminopimelate decarboxylase [Alphaproteobacteria bacterium]
MTCGFSRPDGDLWIDGIPAAEIVAAVGTPAYIYSASAIRSQFADLGVALGAVLAEPPLIAYACKANSNLAVLRLLAGLGAGGDIVSGGELRRCLAAGMPAEKIVFSGVSKSDEEIELGIRHGIRQFNVESEYELGRIASLAKNAGQRANVALRFNPDVDAEAHHKTTTGRAEDKFGLLRSDVERLYAAASGNPNLGMRGLHVHIGSQITRVEHYRTSYERLADLARSLIRAGYPMDTIDLGGGLGIVYDAEKQSAPDLSTYGAIIAQTVGNLGVSLVVEPGRFIVGNAGALVSRMLYVKESGGRRFAVLDAGMNDLIRPALYDSWHGIVPVLPRQGEERPCDVVGPVCETGDTFAVQRTLPPLESGDLVAIMSAGAYGATMSSNYNTRPLPPEVLVDGDRFAIIRNRQDVQSLLDQDIIPDWL